MDLFIIFGAKYLIFIIVFLAACFVLLQDRKRQRKILMFALVVLPVSYMLAKIGSLFYFDPRPFVVGNFATIISHAADNGFPSDHTLLAGTAALVMFPFNKKLGVVLFLLALLVGLSRVLAGVHHFVDIFGSLFIAIVVSYVVYYFVIPKISKN